MIPMSPGQRRMWFLQQAHGPRPTYNMPITLRLTGPLDIDALRAALADLVLRHEVLRTLLRSGPDGAPQQIVLSGASAVAPLEVLSATEEQASPLMHERARYAFDLESELPLRATILQIGPDRHVLQLVVHHAACDGWSLAPLVQDLAQAYRSRSWGRAPEFASLVVSYADYSHWYEEFLGQATDPLSLRQRQIDFWREALHGTTPGIGIAADTGRRASGNGRSIAVELPAEVHQGLQKECTEAGATLLMALQALLAATLSRLGAGPDIPLGTVVSGRIDEALEPMVGFFVNTVVLRSDVGGDPSFRELLGRVRQADLVAFEHADVPFDEVVDALRPVRVAGETPFFRVGFGVQDDPREIRPDFGAVRADLGLERFGVAKFALDVQFVVRRTESLEPGGISVEIDYDTGIHEPSTAHRLASTLARLAGTVVGAPERPISAHPILSADEIETLVYDWGRSPAGVSSGPVAASIPARFREVAWQAADSVAIHGADRTLTYRELDHHSDELARRLLAAELRPEEPVAVLTSRSAGSLVAFLAVLKAGGVYLPVHEAQPLSRIRSILASAGTRILLTGSPDTGPGRLAAQLTGHLQIPVDPATPAATTGGPALPELTITPDRAAYVMFTSGSSGEPKGVVVSHGEILALTADPLFASLAHRRVLLISPLAFDVSTYGLWVPLLRHGGTAVVSPPGGVDAGLIRKLITEHSIGAMDVTAGLLRALVDEDPACFSGLTELITGGDVISAVAVTRVLNSCPGLAVRVTYGPTESTLYATSARYRITDQVPSPVPLGRALAGGQTLVLDRQLNPVPPGTVGELYLAGVGLARGYAGAAGPSAERFVAAPWGPPGSRMYRTGDLASWSEAGELRFSGRADDQLKIRGFRVEPREVEAALLSCRAVADCIVLAGPDRHGDKELIAYIVPGPADDAPDDLADSVRAELADLLAPYMVPARIVLVPALPVTTNGKVDHQALTAMGGPAGPVAPAPSRAAVRDLPEQIVTEIFSDVLKIPPVGPDEDFFRLGGHSLLATHLVSRIGAAFGVDLGIREVFEAPTVGGLVSRLAISPASRRPAITRREPPPLIPASFAQRRLWLTEQIEGPGVTYNLPVVLRLVGELELRHLVGALGDLVRRHEPLHTLLREQDGELRQVVVPVTAEPKIVKVETVTRTTLPAAIERAGSACFDLAEDIPCRATVLSLGDAEHVLVLLTHHSATDGWSVGILETELAELYTARIELRPAALPQLPVSYTDYTLWQRELLGSETRPSDLALDQVSFWTRTLAGLPTALQYSWSRRNAGSADGRGTTVPLSLSAQVHSSLVDLARSTGTTFFMVAQAALAMTLTRLGSGSDIPIGTPAHGRSQAQLEHLVGFFVNMLVLRTDTSDDPTFVQLLHRIRQTDLAAYAHQDLPFERVVEAVNPPRSPGRHPLFQVLLAVESGQRPEPRMPGLAVHRDDITLPVAKFDLSVDFIESYGKDGLPAGVQGTVEVALDSFTPEQAQWFAERLRLVLENVAVRPDLPLSQVEVLSGPERETILRDWNASAHPAVAAGSITELLEDQAERTPDAVAVVRRQERLTFAELNGRANRLAHELIAHGAGRSTRVALLLPRTLDMIVALLAVLKTGAAYVPMSTRHPRERLRLILQDVQPVLVISTPDQRPTLPEDLGYPVLDLHDEDFVARSAEHPAGNPARNPRAPHPDEMVYAIYTSGSTGRPKGVGVSHRGLLNLFMVHQRTVITPCERQHPGRQLRAAFTDEISFDASWGTLIWLFAGHQLHIIDDDLRDDPTGLAAYAARVGIDLVNTTPSYAKHLLSAGLATPDGYQPSALTLGGEVVNDAFWAQLGYLRTRAYNFYGPTEFTVDALCAPITAGAPATIGRPLPNSRVYVLDEHLRPVVPGVIGELYLAGPQIAIGYLNQPGMTAARFVAAPFGPPGERLYRSGDLASWTSDGEVRFEGRADTQVKIRGFRVELGDIESALATAPSVARAAVLVREDRPGDQRLVAYAVPVPGAAIDADALIELARTLMPDYMVPAAVLAVPDLPLTTNGKLDVSSLPAPADLVQPASTPPRDSHELSVAAAFEDVLGVSPVGIHDDFFRLGGHSLLALQLSSRLADAGRLPITIRTLLEAPTVARLAEVLRSQTDTPTTLSARADERMLDVVLPLRQPAGPVAVVPRPPLFCIHPAVGISWVYTGLLKYLPDDQAVYGLQARGLAHPQAGPISFGSMVDDYATQIARIAPQGPVMLLGWSFGGLVAHALATRLQASNRPVPALVMLDSYPATPSASVEASSPEVESDLLSSVGLTQDDHDGPLAELIRPRLDRLTRVFADIANVAADFQPQPYRGDLTFFRAAVKESTDVDAPQVWTPWVHGRIVVHDVHCTHGEMTAPGPLNSIGPLVAARIAPGWGPGIEYR